MRRSGDGDLKAQRFAALASYLVILCAALLACGCRVALILESVMILHTQRTSNAISSHSTSQPLRPLSIGNSSCSIVMCNCTLACCRYYEIIPTLRKYLA